jgi:D-amino-acid dehydrogenase
MSERDVLVIGAGAVGLAAAGALARAGVSVEVVDAGRIGSGSSLGNAGLVVPSFCLPTARPETIREGLRLLGRDHAPFRIHLPPGPALLGWMVRLALAARGGRVARSAAAMQGLAERSLELWRELAARYEFDFRARGWLHVYRTPAALEGAVRDAEWLERLGVRSRRLGPGEVEKLEPRLAPGLAGGIHFLDDAQLDPGLALRALAEEARAHGVTIVEEARVERLVVRDGRVAEVVTERDRRRPRWVVAAAGAWTPRLLRTAGGRVPVQPGRGYSITLPASPFAPGLPLMLGEEHVVITPMGRGVRATTGLDLGEWGRDVDRERIAALRSAVARALPDLADLDPGPAWVGMRPMTPDGPPIVRRLRQATNCVVATGHGALGMTLAPVTGELVVAHLRSCATEM